MGERGAWLRGPIRPRRSQEMEPSPRRRQPWPCSTGRGSGFLGTVPPPHRDAHSPGIFVVQLVLLVAARLQRDGAARALARIHTHRAWAPGCCPQGWSQQQTLASAQGARAVLMNLVTSRCWGPPPGCSHCPAPRRCPPASHRRSRAMSSCLVLRRHLSLLLSTVLEKRVSTTEGGCWCRRQSTVHSQCCSSNEGKRSPGCESSWCSSTQKPCCLCYLGWWLCCTTSLPGGGPCPVPECQWGPCGGVEALSRVPGAAGPAASPLPSRAGPVCVSTSSPRLQSLSSGEQQRGGNNPGVLKCCWDLRAGFLSLFGGMQEEGEHLLEPCRSSSSFTWMCAGGSGVQLGAPRSRQCRRAVRPPSQHGHRSAPGARRPSPWHLHHPTWCQECSWWGWRC